MPFDISNTNKFPIRIPDASLEEAGVMTPAQVAQLDNLSRGAFMVVVSQPADGQSFTVTIPAAARLGTSNYKVSITIATSGAYTQFVTPFASQTPTTFAIETDGVFPNGTILLCSLEKLLP